MVDKEAGADDSRWEKAESVRSFDSVSTTASLSDEPELDGPRPTSASAAAEGGKQKARRKSQRKKDREWESQRENFRQLYFVQDLPLKDVMKIMEEKHGFKASRKQYNTKIGHWRLDKKVKDFEMRAIIRKLWAREAEDPPKRSIFRVRNKVVPIEKIRRFQRDKGITIDIINDGERTPSDISCETLPRSTPRTMSIKSEAEEVEQPARSSSSSISKKKEDEGKEEPMKIKAEEKEDSPMDYSPISPTFEDHPWASMFEISEDSYMDEFVNWNGEAEENRPSARLKGKKVVRPRPVITRGYMPISHQPKPSNKNGNKKKMQPRSATAYDPPIHFRRGEEGFHFQPSDDLFADFDSMDYNHDSKTEPSLTDASPSQLAFPSHSASVILSGLQPITPISSIAEETSHPSSAVSPSSSQTSFKRTGSPPILTQRQSKVPRMSPATQLITDMAIARRDYQTDPPTPNSWAEVSKLAQTLPENKECREGACRLAPKTFKTEFEWIRHSYEHQAERSATEPYQTRRSPKPAGSTYPPPLTMVPRNKLKSRYLSSAYRSPRRYRASKEVSPSNRSYHSFSTSSLSGLTFEQIAEQSSEDVSTLERDYHSSLLTGDAASRYLSSSLYASHASVANSAGAHPPESASSFVAQSPSSQLDHILEAPDEMANLAVNEYHRALVFVNARRKDMHAARGHQRSLTAPSASTAGSSGASLAAAPSTPRPGAPHGFPPGVFLAHQTIPEKAGDGELFERLQNLSPTGAYHHGGDSGASFDFGRLNLDFTHIDLSDLGDLPYLRGD